MRKALALTDAQAVVVQAETGGGFGGKEEYPSIIALHAALLARKTGRPVRMIYDRHEDIAATTKRHPAVVRHRTGVMHDGTLVAQEIEVVMDGGAYCTLTPGRPVARRASCRRARTAARTSGSTRGRHARTPRRTARSAASVPRRSSSRWKPISTGSPRRSSCPRSRSAAATSTAIGDETPTGQILHESVAGEEVLERAAEAAEFERMRERTQRARAEREGSGTVPAGRLVTGSARTATGIGLALGWHGAGFTGSGEVKLASVASVQLTGDGRIEILIASTEMGQGTKTIFPQLVSAELGVGFDDVEIVDPDTSKVPDSGPTVASRTAMVVGGLCIKAARRLRAEVEERNPGKSFAEAYQDDARANGATRIDQQFEPYPGIEFDDETYRGDAYPAFGWAACVATVEVDLDTGEVIVRDVVAADDIGRVIHPILAEGQVEGGTLQAVGYATIEEIKLQDGRYLNDRMATYLIPTSLDAPRITDDPRRGAVQRRATRREGRRRAADGRRSSRRGRRDPRRGGGLDPGSAGIARTDPRRPAWRGRVGRRSASGSGVVTTVRFLVNGAPVELDVPGMRRLLDVLREDLGIDRSQGRVRRGGVWRLHRDPRW